MNNNHRLILVGIIGFTFSAWFTIATGAAYALVTGLISLGLFIWLLLALMLFTMPDNEPRKRFKNCRKIEL